MIDCRYSVELGGYKYNTSQHNTIQTQRKTSHSLGDTFDGAVFSVVLRSDGTEFKVTTARGSSFSVAADTSILHTTINTVLQYQHRYTQFSDIKVP